MCANAAAANHGHELVLTRLIDAPREKLFRCWTEPKLMKQCTLFPYTTLFRSNRKSVV